MYGRYQHIPPHLLKHCAHTITLRSPNTIMHSYKILSQFSHLETKCTKFKFIRGTR